MVTPVVLSLAQACSAAESDDLGCKVDESFRATY
jgi:hypothetical protein